MIKIKNDINESCSSNLVYSNPSKLANFGGKKIGDREFGNRELGCYFTNEKSIWGFFIY